MTLSFLPPADFETLALAWVGVGIVVSSAVIAAFARLVPSLLELYAEVRFHSAQIETNTAAITQMTGRLADAQPVISLIRKGTVTPLSGSEGTKVMTFNGDVHAGPVAPEPGKVEP